MQVPSDKKNFTWNVTVRDCQLLNVFDGGRKNTHCCCLCQPLHVQAMASQSVLRVAEKHQATSLGMRGKSEKLQIGYIRKIYPENRG